MIQFLTIADSIKATENNIDYTKDIFKSENVDGDVLIKETSTGTYYIQNYKIELVNSNARSTVGESTTGKVIAGREIFTEEEYMAKLRKTQTRGSINDEYNGRSTKLYCEINYTTGIVSGESGIRFDSFYCVSSGSTLTSYVVRYGVLGRRCGGNAFNDDHTVNVNTTTKTLSVNVLATHNWPYMWNGPGNDLTMGVTQTYTMTTGYTDTWTLNV